MEVAQTEGLITPRGGINDAIVPGRARPWCSVAPVSFPLPVSAFLSIQLPGSSPPAPLPLLQACQKSMLPPHSPPGLAIPAPPA